MRVRLHRISQSRHVTEVLRRDGSSSRQELDSRSFLRHDLMHWCIEHRAGIARALWGNAARGAMVGASPDGGTGAADELARTEVLVGLFQGAVARGADPAAFAATAHDYLAQVGVPAPPFLDAAFVHAVLADYRRLHGQWLSLRIGGVLELDGTATLDG